MVEEISGLKNICEYQISINLFPCPKTPPAVRNNQGICKNPAMKTPKCPTSAIMPETKKIDLLFPCGDTILSLHTGGSYFGELINFLLHLYSCAPESMELVRDADSVFLYIFTVTVSCRYSNYTQNLRMRFCVRFCIVVVCSSSAGHLETALRGHQFYLQTRLTDFLLLLLRTGLTRLHAVKGFYDFSNPTFLPATIGIKNVTKASIRRVPIINRD